MTTPHADRARAIEEQADAILAAVDHASDDEAPAPPPGPLEPLYRWLELRQRWLFYPLFGGLLLWPLLGSEVGLSVTGGAVVAAGLVPFITGRYRTRFMRLYGLPARLRGLFSIGMGLFVIYSGFALP